MKQKLIALFFALGASAGTLFAQSGKCGDKLTWTLSNGTLTISGTGRMYDYDPHCEPYFAPWDSYFPITKVVINSGVTSIGDYAFDDFPSLTSVMIPNSVTRIGSSAFSGCSNLTSITIPNSVMRIGSSAFYNCFRLTSIMIPNSVTSLGDSAFYYCDDLTSVTIGNSVTSIGNYTFCECSSLASITIPNSVRSIGDSAFYYCSSLKSVTIGNSVTSIGDDAFRECSNLTSITIPNSVKSIGDDAFRSCDNLISVTIGNSVTSIGEWAFSNCDIISVTCYAKNPPTLDRLSFYNIPQRAILYVPANAVSAYNANENWENSFSQILPIGATPVTTNGVQVVPTDNTVVIQWPTNANAGSYELVIRDKDGNALCTLVFNAQGQLTSIAFAAAPARDRSNVAAMAQGTGFAFTVTGLESGTTYSYTLKTKNASGAVIDTKTDSFTTQSPTALEDIMDNSSSSSVRKVLHNGQLYILRDSKAYNAQGAEVR